MSLRPMWRRRGCGGRMSVRSGGEWGGMFGLVWGIERCCCVEVWWWGPGGKVLSTVLYINYLEFGEGKRREESRWGIFWSHGFGAYYLTHVRAIRPVSLSRMKWMKPMTFTRPSFLNQRVFNRKLIRSQVPPQLYTYHMYVFIQYSIVHVVLVSVWFIQLFGKFSCYVLYGYGYMYICLIRAILYACTCTYDMAWHHF